MNCREIQTVIHAYIDGELDLMKCLEVEGHLQECPACARDQAGFQSIRAAIKGSDLYERTPPGLARRVRSSLRQASRTHRPLRPLLAVAASLALILATSWGLARIRVARPDGGSLTRELVAGHIRSGMLPSHRFDVESTDAHTVKPWFEGKLDFSPPVKDLAGQGFPLVGGRLDYLNNRPVAAMVYGRRKHSINLFVWPTSPGEEAAPSTATRQGFHLIRWTGSAMTFWAVSDLNERELQDFAQLLRDEIR